MVRHDMPIQAIVFGPDFDPSKARFDLQTTEVNKPKQALWTSTFDPNIHKIGWIEWNLREQTGMLKSCLYKLVPKPSLKVYEIDNAGDWLNRRLPKIKGKSMFLEFLFGSNHNEGFIDFEALKNRGYDGVRVTSNGAALGHNFDIERRITLALNSWDLESTVWFNTTWIKSWELVTDNLAMLL